MTEPNTIDQILEYLREHGVDHYSTIEIVGRENAWDVSIDERHSDKILLWSGLLEDPTPVLEQYATENPDLHLRVKTL